MRENEFEFIDNDFEFIGNTCHLRCTRFQAVFISPRVHWLLQQDQTSTSFFVEWTSRAMKEDRVFEFLSDLMNGKPIERLASEVEGLCDVATALGNTELLDWLIRDADPLNRLTVCGRLKRNSAVGGSVDEEVEFAASHFYEIDAEDLKGIDVGLLELIVSSDRLQLESEGSLLTFILNLGLEDALVLVRYLLIESLSADGMSLLLDGFGESIFDRLVWDSLCRRLVLRLRRTVEKEKANATKSLDGIISYLTKKHGGNVQEKGIVTITSKSAQDPSYDGSNMPIKYAINRIADAGSALGFISKNEPGQWVCWDFREMRVRPTHCTIQACYLKSWIVEGSLDGSAWTEIDRQTNNQDFKNWWNTASFAVSKPAEFRFIRLTQTDKRPFYDDDVLSLCAVEFFGTLSE
jgi:hypothetical protein